MHPAAAGRVGTEKHPERAPKRLSSEGLKLVGVMRV